MAAGAALRFGGVNCKRLDGVDASGDVLLLEPIGGAPSGERFLFPESFALLGEPRSGDSSLPLENPTERLRGCSVSGEGEPLAAGDGDRAEVEGVETPFSTPVICKGLGTNGSWDAPGASGFSSFPEILARFFEI